jgi:hypothetical protein
LDSVSGMPVRQLTIIADQVAESDGVDGLDADRL